MSTPDFSRFMSPREFGANFKPPRSERSVYRLARTGSCVVINLPGMPLKIDAEATYRKWEQGGRQLLQRRQGRRASRSK